MVICWTVFGIQGMPRVQVVGTTLMEGYGRSGVVVPSCGKFVQFRLGVLWIFPLLTSRVPTT